MDWLNRYMFKNEKDAPKVEEIVDFFSDYDTHLTHSRPLIINKIADFGIKIEIADGDLKDLLWEAFILIDGLFNSTPYVKLYENSENLSYGKAVKVSVQGNIQRDQLKG